MTHRLACARRDKNTRIRTMSQPDTHVRIQPKVYGYTHARPVKLAAELLNFRKIGELKKRLQWFYGPAKLLDS